MQILLWPAVVSLLWTRPETPPLVAFRPVSAVEYQGARALARPLKVPATFPVQARNGQFIIPTTAGPQAYRNIIIDAAAVARGHSEEEETHYTYLGLLTPFRRHLVEVALYETGQWWLISPEGRRLTLYGPPLYSPDQRSVAAFSPGLEYSGGQPNVVQLLRLQNGVLRPLWELQPTTWEPKELFWTGPNTLYLKGEQWTRNQGKPVYWQLTVREQ